jgi:hypothetical protein
MPLFVLILNQKCQLSRHHRVMEYGVNFAKLYGDDKLWSSYCGPQDQLPQTRLFGYGDTNEKANKKN